MTQNAFHISPNKLSSEHWDDAVCNRVAWKIFVSADRTPSKELFYGIANFPLGGILRRHSHQKAEVIHVIFGEGAGTLAGEKLNLSIGDTVFVPTGTSHVRGAPADGWGGF